MSVRIDYEHADKIREWYYGKDSRDPTHFIVDAALPERDRDMYMIDPSDEKLVDGSMWVFDAVTGNAIGVLVKVERGNHE